MHNKRDILQDGLQQHSDDVRDLICECVRNEIFGCTISIIMFK